MRIDNKIEIYLNENDMKEIIAKYFNVSIENVKINIYEDRYYGDKSINAIVTK